MLTISRSPFLIGLIPLHNAASYGHLDVAALLIKYNTNVNATDKWGFTPLHEGQYYKSNEILEITKQKILPSKFSIAKRANIIMCSSLKLWS